jgi:Tat protein translocase TatB subunit
VVLLILESLGSTELLFILVMALVFFGPRKLPQLSRTLGKNLAEFRKASEDFKRTWEREVSLEESDSSSSDATPAMLSGESSILDEAKVSRPFQSPTIEPVAADQVIPRQPIEMDTLQSADATNFADDRAEPLRKRDWL